MGLFSKKYDKEKDKLKLAFNSELKKYQFYYKDILIEYKDLNRKTKKFLDEKNKFLETSPYMMDYEMMLISKSKSIDRGKLLNSIGYKTETFEYLGINNGTMSEYLDKYLNHLVNLDNVLIGIHRVGCLPDKYIEDILLNGIVMTGHMGSGAITTPKLEYNVSYYSDNKTIIKELMYADTYKNSRGSILIKIPDADLTKNIFIINNGEVRLNPKYILGYIPVSNHHIENIITKEDILKQRRIESNNYSNDTLETIKYR